MKKTVFTICSVLTVCAVIIMSCEKKDDPNMHKVYYSSQQGYGTGTNPNPNGVATSGGSATTSGTTSGGTSTTGSSCATTINSVSGSCSPSGNSFVITAGSSVVLIAFPGTSAPSPGNYSIVIGSPVGNQCTFQDGSSNAAGGTVTVSASPNKVTFSGIVCGSVTYSGTGCY